MRKVFFEYAQVVSVSVRNALREVRDYAETPRRYISDQSVQYFHSCRGGEMADASALGADGSNPMEVQVLSPAPSGFVPSGALRRDWYDQQMRSGTLSSPFSYAEVVIRFFETGVTAPIKKARSDCCASGMLRVS